MLSETMLNMVRGTIETAVLSHTSEGTAAEWDFAGLRADLMGYLCTDEDFNYTEDELKKLTQQDVVKMLTERAEARIHEREELFTPDRFREVERAILLQNVDRGWMPFHSRF